MHKIWFLSVSVSSQYFKSLNPLRMKNIAYIGSWKHFVFVFVCVFVFVITRRQPIWYFKSLNPLLLINIAYIGSWKHFVFVFVCVSLSLYLSFCKYSSRSLSLSLSLSSQEDRQYNILNPWIPLLLISIAYIGSWKHFVFVFVCVCVSLSLSFCKYLSRSLSSADEKLSENIWFVWSRTSYSGDKWLKVGRRKWCHHGDERPNKWK